MEIFQNTIEWLQWRVLGIGSSDGPIIMGKSKFKTKLELWNEKFNKIVKEDDEPNFIQKKGHRLEVYVRGIMEFRTGREWKPKLFTHEKFPFMRASLDGWNEEIREGWECKYMGQEMFLNLMDLKKSIMERIPEEYLDQICHQFFVTNANAITLSGVCDTLEVDEAGNKLKTVGHLRIPLTEELKNYIVEKYAPAAFAFWESIQKGEKPEEEKRDVVEITDADLQEKILKYAELHAQENKIKNEKDDFKRLIYSHPARTHGNMIYKGHKIYIMAGAQETDYKAAFKDFCSWLHQLKTAALNFEIDMNTVWQSITSFPDQPNLEKYITTKKDSLVIRTGKPPKTAAEEGLDFKVGHVPPKKHNDDPYDFILPTTGRRPVNWVKKSIPERIEYLEKHIKKEKDISELDRKMINDFIELMSKMLPPEPEPKTAEQIVDEVLNEEKKEVEKIKALREEVIKENENAQA